MLSSLALAVTAAFAGPSASLPLASVPTVSASPTVAAVAGDNLPEGATIVSFETKDKQLLSGSLYLPKKKKKSKGPAPAALLLHDAGKSRADLEELAAYLHKKGFAVLTVDLRGHGASVSDESDFEKKDDKGKETLWGLSTRDVDAAADFLLEQDGVHSTNLSIFGAGAGASLAVRRATDDENVRAVVLIDPEAKAFGYNLANGVGDLGGLPTYIVAGKDKKDVAKRIQESAHEANDGLAYVELSLLKSAGEKIFDDKKLKSSAAGWLRDQVMPRK